MILTVILHKDAGTLNALCLHMSVRIRDEIDEVRTQVQINLVLFNNKIKQRATKTTLKGKSRQAGRQSNVCTVNIAHMT